jgi:flagellar biosynthesis/type III secretory pathway M-ring protein FliF/YscJ
VHYITVPTTKLTTTTPKLTTTTPKRTTTKSTPKTTVKINDVVTFAPLDDPPIDVEENEETRPHIVDVSNQFSNEDTDHVLLYSISAIFAVAVFTIASFVAIRRFYNRSNPLQHLKERSRKGQGQKNGGLTDDIHFLTADEQIDFTLAVI